jgi:MoaA/NifB/PqqE/SkfB family radical SAM enzyme
VNGISVASKKVSVTINTTIMNENIDEIENIVELAKQLGTKRSIAAAHEYCNDKVSSTAEDKIRKTAIALNENETGRISNCQLNWLFESNG